MSAEVQLLDITDRTRRPLQNGAVLAGVLVLIVAGAAAKRPGGIALTLWLMAAGFALFGVAAFVKQKWAIIYKGHDIRFENNPFLGEKLFIDGQLAGKGKIGYLSEIRGAISKGDGTGDTIVSRSEAGFLSVRCRMIAFAADAGGAAAAVSDEQLLAEVRRRGLKN